MNYKELVEPIYHGTFEFFEAINLSKSAPKKDYGRGFYTTNDYAQASKFARLKAKRESRKQGYVLTFEFVGNEDLIVKRFTSSDEEWFDYVLFNRGFGNYAKLESNAAYDIVIGPIANDAVGIVLNNFIDGVYGNQNSSESKETAIRLLLTQKLHSQIFFGTERAINHLVFKEVSDVYLD